MDVVIRCAWQEDHGWQGHEPVKTLRELADDLERHGEVIDIDTSLLADLGASVGGA